MPSALSCLQVQLKRTALRSGRSAETSSLLRMTSSVDGGLSIGRTLQVDDLLMISEESLKTISDSQLFVQTEDSFEARKEDKLVFSAILIILQSAQAKPLMAYGSDLAGLLPPWLGACHSIVLC